MYRWRKYNSNESKNGDILAMATYPAYDLNSPYEPHTDEQKAGWENLDSQDRTTAMQKCGETKRYQIHMSQVQFLKQ